MNNNNKKKKTGVRKCVTKHSVHRDTLLLVLLKCNEAQSKLFSLELFYVKLETRVFGRPFFKLSHIFFFFYVRDVAVTSSSGCKYAYWLVMCPCDMSLSTTS